MADPSKAAKTPGYPLSSGESTATRLPIGFPPVELYFSNEVLKGSIPLMYLIPGQGQFVAGLDVFHFDDKLGEFQDMLMNDYDILLKTDSNAIPIAFLPEAIPGIQLSNDYGASFLESITSVGGPLLGQLAQMSGSTSLGSLAQKLPGQLGGAVAGQRGKGAGEWASGKIGDLIKGIAGLGEKAIDKLPTNTQQGVRNMVSTGLSVVGQMLTGARVDFPKVWMGSGFSGPVSIPVRLYNPNQASDVCYNKYIIEPLTVLLMLGAPLSDQDNLYRWPYIHQIWSPGLFKWKMASCIGITVQPGPENQMSWNNRPSMIDVRLEFQPLHSVMLGRRTSTSVPSVGDYIDQLGERTVAPKMYGPQPGAPNVTSTSRGIPSDEDIVTAPGTPTSTVDPTAYQNPSPRVMSDDEADAAYLKKKEADAATAPGEVDREARIVAGRDKELEASKLDQAKQTQEMEDYAGQNAEQKALQDKKLQDQLEAAQYYEGVRPETQATQVAGLTPGASRDQMIDAAEAMAAVPEDSAYIQDEYGAVPGDSKNVPKELPEGGKAPGQSDSFWGGVSSKLTATGTAVYAAGTKIATSVIDGASSKAKQLSESITKATGTVKDLGQSIKTTITPKPTVEEVKKADTFPTTAEETVKAQVEPTVAASQEKMQARSSAIAGENQKYTSGVQVLNTGIQKTTNLYNSGGMTKEQYEATINTYNRGLNGIKVAHENSLATIENKYI